MSQSKNQNANSKSRLQDSQLHDRTENSISQMRSMEFRRGFMGSQSRLFNVMNQSVIHGNSFQHQQNLDISDEHSGGGVFFMGTNFDIKEVETKITNFVKTNCMEKLKLVKETDEYTVVINAQEIYTFDKQFYFKLIKYPAEAILYLDRILNEIYKETQLDENQRQNYDKYILTKIVNLRKTSRIRELLPKEINSLISVKGVVIRSSDLYPEMKDALFKCTNCGHTVSEVLERGKIQEPTSCTRCFEKKSFELIHNQCMFTDKQYVRLQETPEFIPEGETPLTLSLVMYDDIVDSCKPGDSVEVIGIYRAQPFRVHPNKSIISSVFRYYIDVVSVYLSNKKRAIEDNEYVIEQDKMVFSPEDKAQFKLFSESSDLKQRLYDCFAPSIWEMEDVKKGLLCQLFGGVEKQFDPSVRSRFRSDLNVLLLGDPSTAKSKLLTYVHQISPRGIYTSGKGSSGVGLTAYISKDQETHEIILEPGALVLSDKGICCIDEFDKMDDGTKAILHEVMEQQSISIAKAGIVCSLNARTAILAAANPIESKYNPQKSIIYNIKLPPALLSRFDLIYILLDKQNDLQDSRLAAHILNLYTLKLDTDPKNDQKQKQAFLSKYIRYARIHCNPIFTPEAEDNLIKVYLEMRKQGYSRNSISATPRHLESLMRISEALAKMRLSKTVEVFDVNEAKSLFAIATQSAAIDPTTGTIDMGILNTGFSSGLKDKVAKIVEVLRKILDQLEEQMRIGMSAAKLKIEIINFSKRQIEDIQNQELGESLRQLEEEKLIKIYGDKYSDMAKITKIDMDYQTVQIILLYLYILCTFNFIIIV